jgi:hypothetical protein
MKIVINSNINYKKPVQVLLESLCESGFYEFNDVVLVVSQCEDQIGPEIINVNEVIQDLRLPNIEVCVVRMQMNNFDYSGYHALHMYKNDPLIEDEGYLYVLDTSTFDEDFFDKYSDLKPEKGGVVTCFHPHSNICMIDREVVSNYGDNFSTILTKGEAIHLEWNNEINKCGKTVKGITQFGKFVSTGDRIMMGAEDIYGTGHPRVRVNYPAFGINKWILWGQNGDMTGQLVAN